MLWGDLRFSYPMAEITSRSWEKHKAKLIRAHSYNTNPWDEEKITPETYYLIHRYRNNDVTKSLYMLTRYHWIDTDSFGFFVVTQPPGLSLGFPHIPVGRIYSS